MLNQPDTQTFNEGQSQIVQNLTLIDQLTSVVPVPPENADQLRQLFTETIVWIDNHFASFEPEIVYQLLEFLTHYYEAS